MTATPIASAPASDIERFTNAGMCDELDAAILEAQSALHDAVFAAELAEAARAVAQDEANGFEAKLRPLLSRMQSRAESLAPFLSARREEMATRLRKARSAKTAADLAVVSAERRLGQLRDAKAQVAQLAPDGALSEATSS